MIIHQICGRIGGESEDDTFFYMEDDIINSVFISCLILNHMIYYDVCIGKRLVDLVNPLAHRATGLKG